MSEVRIDAPAKINLGLEVIRKRDDGYHEIRTVLAMLELADTLTVFQSDAFIGDDLDGVPAETNLISRALDAFREAVPDSPSFGWSIIKRVPAAAGLGGASSDAASALIAANVLAGSPLSSQDLADVAGTLGSDITFFLGSPCALATGRGTDLASLTPPRWDILLIIPDDKLHTKTKTLYRALTPQDYTSGKRVERVAGILETQMAPDAGLLLNAFTRPLHTLLPRIGNLQLSLARLGYPAFGLSGAGPAHYVICPSDSHEDIVDELSKLFGNWLSFISTSTRYEPVAFQEQVSG